MYINVNLTVIFEIGIFYVIIKKNKINGKSKILDFMINLPYKNNNSLSVKTYFYF